MSGTISEALGYDDQQLENSETIYGVVPAVVSNLKDPEKLGRVKVTFPWLAKESETDWVRVLSFYAGAGRGAFFLPEVGDEVLVAFQKGNINAPYVIGSLWSSKSKPPEKNDDGKNNVKVFQSREGHKITFTDDSRSKKLEIESSGGSTITLNDASGKEKIEIKDKSGQNKIILDATKKSVSIESGMKLDIKAKTITIEAQTALTLKTAMLKAEASGIAAIKGSMVKIN